jgi:ERCC4-type nuclease
MNIQVDVRERDLYAACTPLLKDNITIESVNLVLGDIRVGEDVVIERKTWTDLAASIKDGRYREQSFRLQNALAEGQRIYYFLEGDLERYHGSYPSRDSLLHAMFSLTNKGFFVIQTKSVAQSASYLVHLAQKKLTDTGKKGASVQTYEGCSVTKQKKAHITPENISVFMLSQIPHVSTTIAEHLLARYKHLSVLCKALAEDPGQLDTFVVNKRKIGKNVVDNLKRFLIYQPAAEEEPTESDAELASVES